MSQLRLRTFFLSSTLSLGLSVSLLGAAGCGGTETIGTPQSSALTFEGQGNGSQAVPPTATDASASVNLTLSADQGQLAYKVQHNVTAATQVEIRRGASGAQGELLFTLKGDAMSSGTLQVTADQAAALMAGTLYFDIPSVVFAAGEIRGQFFSLDGTQIAVTGTTQLSANLSGLQQIPPVELSADGKASLTLDEKTGTLSYDISHGLTGATSVAIKQGNVGISGAVVFSLAQSTTGMLATQISGKQMLSAEQRVQLKSGALYLEVQSLLQGTLRGQILTSTALPFATQLKAAPLVSTSATGMVTFLLSQDGNTLAFRLNHDLQDVTKAALVKQMLGVETTIECQLSDGKDKAQGSCAIRAGGVSKDDLLGGLLQINLATQAHATGELVGKVSVPKQP